MREYEKELWKQKADYDEIVGAWGGLCDHWEIFSRDHPASVPAPRFSDTKDRVNFDWADVRLFCIFRFDGSGKGILSFGYTSTTVDGGKRDMFTGHVQFDKNYTVHDPENTTLGPFTLDHFQWFDYYVIKQIVSATKAAYESRIDAAHHN